MTVSEWDEPQAVIGSNLHRLAYPANFAAHLGRDRALREAYHHTGKNIRSLQLRGEYLYTANGSGGLRVYDVANVDNKGFSERIITAPVSPLGQRAYVRTKDAMSVALPTKPPGEEIAATGFSPPPAPRLIATYATHGPALTLSEGLERDRAVDESGNQIAVFGRLGARPFNREEMERLYLRNGQLFTVATGAPGTPSDFVRPIEPAAPGTGPEAPAVQPLAPRSERLLPGRQ